MTQAAIEKEIEKGIDKTISQIVPEIRGQISEAVTKRLGGAPSTPAKPPALQQPPVQQPQQQPVSATPPAQSVDISPITDVKGEIEGRVNQALAYLVREIQIKPTRGAWIEFVIDNLPQDMVRKLAAAKGPKGFFGVVQPYANPQLAQALFKLLLADPAGQAWLKTQVAFFKQACLEEFGPEIETAPEPPVAEPQSAPAAQAAPAVGAGPLGGLPQSQPPPVAPQQEPGPAGPLGGLSQAQKDESPPPVAE